MQAACAFRLVNLFALSRVKNIGKQDNGIPILASSGQDSKKIGQFNLGDEDAHEIKNKVYGGLKTLDRFAGQRSLALK